MVTWTCWLSSMECVFGLQSKRTGSEKRRQPKPSCEVLDAPALQDDFYLNLVDWSSHNVLAVGLGTCVYLWSACTSRVTKLCDLGPNDSVCSVGWTQRGTYLAVGLASLPGGVRLVTWTVTYRLSTIEPCSDAQQ